MRIVAHVPDLFDRSKVAAAADDIEFVDDPARLAGVEAELVIVDLSRPGVLEVLPLVKVPTLGFGRHTQRELLAAARAAGCDRVLVRSEFFPNLADLVSGG